MAVGSSFAAGQDVRVFRIATGGPGGTYYPIGRTIAKAISASPNAAPCLDPEHCGVPGLLAVAQTSNGSMFNVKEVAKGLVESGFSQSDVAYWAYSGAGAFEGKEPLSNLRAIASLYPETVHLIAARNTGIDSVADLRGKRVSLDEPGSGTLVDSRLVLGAYGLSEADIKPQYIKPGLGAERLRNGDLDAFFFIGGCPVASVESLAASLSIQLVPIGGAARQRLLERYPFLSKARIPSGVYRGVDVTSTISVRAIWITRAAVDETLIYNITRALWNATSRRLLDGDHPMGRAIRLEHALQGIAIPLHSGAARFYREVGLLP